VSVSLRSRHSFLLSLARIVTAWVEKNLEETLSFYRLPRQHRRHLKSTDLLERLNEEIKRRTQVVRIFPNAQSCLRLIRALALETRETWNYPVSMDGVGLAVRLSVC